MPTSVVGGGERVRRGMTLSPLAIAVGAVIFVALSPTAASGTQSTGDVLAADTIRTSTPPRARPRVLFSPVYLGRAIEAVRGRDTAAIVIEIEPPSEEGRAAVYARQYGISKELALQIVETALEEGVDPELGFRLIRVESVFKPNARGPAGSLGLTQLQPSTARAIDGSLRTEAQILEPRANLRTGFRYLRRLLDRYQGDVRLALLAYNRGETAVDRALRAGRDPENGYSRKVLSVSGSTYTGPGLIPKR